jgi:PKD repeat protein
VGQLVTFDASASSDPDGSIVGYSWDFGDGSRATGVNVSHAYQSVGEYRVVLTVTDDQGATGSASATINVVGVNSPPVAVLRVDPTRVLTFEAVRADGSGSYDPDGFIVSHVIEWGDGASTRGSVGSHEYGRAGLYTVVLTVTDDDGASATSSVLVTVLNRPPKAAFTFRPETPEVDSPVRFDASTSSDPDGSIVAYLWDFGDGTTSSGVSIDHVYTFAGRYTVLLTVWDDEGANASTSVQITVVAPRLVVTVSGEFDYLFRERVHIKVAALVTSASTGLPVSGAVATLEIYDDLGNLWASAVMLEHPEGSGVYVWRSSGTIQELGLSKGVYLVRIQASYKGSPAYPGILLFHIDPEDELESVSPFGAVIAAAIIALGVAGAFAGLKRAGLIGSGKRRP